MVGKYVIVIECYCLFIGFVVYLLNLFVCIGLFGITGMHLCTLGGMYAVDVQMIPVRYSESPASTIFR